MSLFTTIRRIAALAAGTLGLALVSANAGAADVVEYYHAELDHYFVTGYAPEIKALDTGVHKGWVRTGFTFQVFDATDPRAANSLDVCRFYGNPERGLDSHFYSASATECDDVKKKWPIDWLLESSEVFKIHAVDPNTGLCPSGTKAVYRLYNRRPDVNHRYTTDPAIVDAMLAKGYVLEGSGNPSRPVVFCSANIAPAQPVTGAPLCTLASSSPLPVVGVPVTLTATCTGNPTTYAWINCTSTGATCTALANAVGTVNYGVVATNGSGAGAPASLALNWQIAAAAAPTCTVAASTTSPQIGSPLVLTSNCSQTPSRYEWLGCSALLTDVCNTISECRSATTSCSPVSTATGPVYYALRASNSAGTSSKAGVAVTWRSGSTVAPPPPPPTSPVPYCTIAPSSSSPAVNTTLTLTASCTNNPTSYQWTNCASTTSICTTTESTALTRNYGVTASNASGVGSPASASVTWQQPPTAPPVCTLAASNPTPYAGQTVTLTATCTQSPTSFSWTGCSATVGNTCQASAAQAGPASYSVTGANQFGPGAPAATSVNWQSAPAAGVDFCGNYPNVVRVDLTWGGHFDTYSNGGFPADAVIVGRIRVPANAAGTASGVVSVVEYIDAQAARIMTLSPSACDFRGFQPGTYPPVDSTGSRNPLAWSFGINPNIFFSLSTAPGGGAKLVPGQTYYVNLRNRDYNSGQSSCQTGTCNVRVTVNPPR
jgi:hypothetical protein